MGLPVFAMAPDQYETLRATKETEKLRQTAIVTSPNRPWYIRADTYPNIYRPRLPRFQSPDSTNPLSDAALRRRIAIDLGVVSATDYEVAGDQIVTIGEGW